MNENNTNKQKTPPNYAVGVKTYSLETQIPSKNTFYQFDKRNGSRYGRDTREYKVKRAFRKEFHLEGFEQVSEQYKPMIHKIINSLHIYKNKEEYYQHGLVALWEASTRFDPEKGNFTNYAYTYIKGYLQSELSKANKYEEKSIYPKEEFWETVEDLFTDIPLEEDILLSYCRTLTENQKKWVLYTAIKGFSVKEIAKIENVSVSAVKSWRAGTKAKLKERAEIF